jgi:acetyl esterase/lipase
MEWLLLGVGTWCALFSRNAFWPPTRPPVLAVVGFFAGWLTIEVALHHLVWQAAAVGLLVAAGGLRAWPGWLGLALAGVAWCGLWVCVAWSARTGRTVGAALAEGLGDVRPASDPADAAALRRDRIRAVELLVPWPLRPRSIERLTDIPYREVSGQVLALDVIRARRAPRGAPTLLWVHGGGWTISDKRFEGGPLMHHLAGRGWVCVTANYRLCPRATFPDPLIDLKHALRWIRESGPDYGADPGFVMAAGGSAGAHLAALLALTAGQPAYQPGFEECDTSVRGCVSIYGIYDLADEAGDVPHDGLRRLVERAFLKVRLSQAPAVFAEASPLRRIHPDAPPFLVLHGDRDTLAPVAGARRFHEALRSGSRAPVCYAELRGAQHAFEVFPSLRAAHVVRGITRFAETLHGAYRSAVAPAAQMYD